VTAGCFSRETHISTFTSKKIFFNRKNTEKKTMARFEAEELVASQLNAREGVLQIGNKTDGGVAVVGRLTVNSGSDAAFSFPQTAGQASQVLTSDGSGGTQWALGGGGGGAVTQIEAADTSCKVQCLDGGTVAMSNSTQTFFQSDTSTTDISSPTLTTSISLSEYYATISGTGILLNSTVFINNNYSLPTQAPSLDGEVIVFGENQTVWRRPPAFAQTFGAAISPSGSYLAINGTIATTSSMSLGPGYQFIVPDYCALTRVSFDVQDPAGVEIMFRNESTADFQPVDGSPGSGTEYVPIDFARGETLSVQVTAGNPSSIIVTCLFDWVVPST